MMPKSLKRGDGLSLDWLNGLRDAIGAGTLRVDPRSGLKLVATPFGSFLRSLAPEEGWYKVTAGLGSGQYTLVEQLPAAGGGWTDGPSTVSAFESNANASVPTSPPAIVWARRRMSRWRFTWGSCS